MCISSRSDFYRIRLCHAVELPGLSPKLLQQTKPPSKLSKPWNNSWFEAAWALHQRYHAEGSLSSTARVSPGRPLGLKSSRAGDVGAQQAGLGRLGCAASKIPASPESLPCTQEKDHLHQAVLSVYYRQIAQHRALTSVRRNASPAVDPPAVNEGQGGYPNRSGLNSAATVSALGCCLAYIARCHAFNYYSNANTHGHSASPASCQGVSTTRFTLATWFLAQLPCSSASSCATCNTRLPKSLFAQFQRVDGTSDAGKTLVTAS